MSKQVFGSALARPWALVKWGGNQPNGRRPSTTVAYLTDPIKGEEHITGYEGGLVEFYRKRARLKAVRDENNKFLRYDTIEPEDPSARWHFRYQKPRTFTLDDICEFFPCGKSRDAGPSESMVRAAKKRVPPNPNEEAA